MGCRQAGQHFSYLLSMLTTYSWEQLRYTDTHILAREREISIKSSPMSLVLQTSVGKSHLVHIIDTPGHVNFSDEVTSAMRLADGIVLVVDVVEGVSADGKHSHRTCLIVTI
jgi:116 kDa U5 small nuclear ribonucleoprotein component